MSIVGDIASAVIGAHAAKKAANTQQKFGEEALQLQRDQYNQTREDFAPWRQAGGAAIGQGFAMLQPGYDYTASPGYQFRLDEGNRAIENSGAAKGLLMSGGTLKDIDRFSQGLAADDYNQSFNRLMSVAAGGQQANTTIAGAGANMANQGAGILQGIGNAKASGYVGASNNYINGLNNVFGSGGSSGSLGGLLSLFGG
jgi:hypothetical protein